MLRGKPKDFSGSATTTLVMKDITNTKGVGTFARRLTFTNNDGTNDLLVTVDNGITFSTIKPNRQMDLEAVVNRFGVKSSAGVVPYTALASIASL